MFQLHPNLSRFLIASIKWIPVTLFVAFQLFTIFERKSGAFFDESLYIIAGIRTFEGFGISDMYLTWFAGHLMWPAIASIAFQIGGLEATRVIALLLVTIALVSSVLVSNILYGNTVSIWTSIVLSISGPILALGQLGVYDTLALAGMSFSYLAMFVLARTNNRAWLFVGAVSFSMGALAKYPMGLMLIPLLGVLLLLRRKKAHVDCSLFLIFSGAVALALLLPTRNQVSQSLIFAFENRPVFGVNGTMILFALGYFTLGSILLAMIGYFKTRSMVSFVLFASLLIWPIYHIISKNPVGDTKHIVFGIMFAGPLIGLGISSVWDFSRVIASIILTGLVIQGGVQFSQLRSGWPDTRETAEYLAQSVKPGENILANNSWPYTLALYQANKVKTPWDVYDTYRLTHDQKNFDVCDATWIIDENGSYEWPVEIWRDIGNCGTFQKIRATTTYVVGLGSDLKYVRYPVITTIYRNVGGGGSRDPTPSIRVTPDPSITMVLPLATE